MVQFLHKDRNRTYKPLSLEERLSIWANRVNQTSRCFKRPREFFLRKNLAEALGLPDNRVFLDENGALWHKSQDKPLICIKGSCE